MNIGDSQRFDYTGTIQELTITESGVYKLDVYGAQGGLWSSYNGGNGGYASGYIALQTGTKIYVVVGGQGEAQASKTPVEGGYNGGGKGVGRKDSSSGSFDFENYGSGGGGATHIALVTGLLSTLESKQDKLLIVAGGGGGGGGRYRADSGGWNARTKGHPGGETSYLTTTFGQGYDYVATGSGSGGGGGGGGYYGGSSANGYSGGGGSSWTGGVQNATTENGVNAGNGYALVTLVIKAEVNPINSGTVNISMSGKIATLNAVASGGYEFVDWTLDNYTRLEYIQSTNTQYIDTGIKTSGDLRIILDSEWTYETGNKSIVGGRNSTSSARFNLSGRSSSTNQITMAYGTGSYNVPTGTLSPSNYGGQRNIFDANKNVWKIIIDDETIVEHSFTYSSFTGSYNVLICGITSGSATGTNLVTLKVYGCKIYDNGILVRDFIPVIRHQDGAIGLLDLVHLKFYGNSGTGSFIGGQPV